LRFSLCAFLICIDENRHGTGIDEFEVHFLLKNTGLNVDPVVAEALDKFFIKRLGNFRSGRFRETGTVTFSTVTIESKLAHNQRGTANIKQTPIHFVVGILKNPQTGNFSGKKSGVFPRVALPDSQQNENAGTCFAGDLSGLHKGDLSMLDSLNANLHILFLVPFLEISSKSRQNYPQFGNPAK